MKTIKYLMMVSVVGLGFAAVGCDTGSTCTDAGVCVDGGAGGAKGGSTGAAGSAGLGGAGGAESLFGLSAGSYCYAVSGLTITSDGCDTGVSALAGSTLPVTYDGVGTLTVGTMGSLGAGAISHGSGTLTRSNMPAQEDMPLCTWTQMDTTTVHLTADNTFTATVTENQSAFATACVPPTGGMCTTSFSMTLSITAAKPDAVTGKCL